MAYYHCGGGVEVEHVVMISESDYNNLQNKDNNTLYLVTYSNGVTIYKKFVGYKQLETDTANHDLFLKNVYKYCPVSGSTLFSIDNNSIPTGIIFDSDHYTKNWKIELRADFLKFGNIGSSENTIIGGATSGYFSIFASGYQSSDLTLYYDGHNIVTIPDVNNHIIKFEYNNSTRTLSAYKDDVLVNTVSLTINQSMNELYLFRYSTSQYFTGYLDFFSFDWLS